MFIKTKVCVPLVRSTMLDRQILADKLTRGRGRRLITIVGQAASGKTSLVSQWITGNGLRCAWYSLDENDNEPDIFFRYLLTALAETDDEISDEVGRLLRGQERLSATNILPVIVEYATNLPVDTYLVLDDYHVIISKDVHGAVLSLLDYLPPKLHVVLISRYEIPFSLSKLKIRDQMAEISAADLRLTEEETSIFFSKIMPLQLSSERLRTLTTYTDGWIGGLQLIGLSLQGKENSSSFNEVLKSVRHTTSDYLIHEVIQVQPENVRAFVHATVHLNRFNADICREITGIEDVSQIINYLYQRNLFLAPLDTDHTWYSYHHMFSEALRANTGITSPDTRSKIHQKAAVWFARNGYLEDAFQHAFASGDIEFIADLMEGYITVLFDRCEIKSARRWLSVLPRDVLMNHPLLRLYECLMCKTPSLEMAALEATIKDLEDNFESAAGRYKGAKRRGFLDFFIFLKQMLCYCRDPVSVELDSMKEAFKQISRGDEPSRQVLQTTIAACLLYQGKASMAEAAANEIASAIFSSNSSFRIVLWFRTMVDIRRWQGDLSGVEKTLNEGLLFLKERQLQDTALGYYLHMSMASLLYARNELDKAKSYAIATLRCAHHANFVSGIAEGTFLLSLIQMAMGRPGKVNACVHQIQAVSKACQSPSIMGFSNAYTALLSLMQGELGFAEQWAEQRRLSMDESFSVRFFFEALLQARIYYFKGMYAEAEQILEKLRDICVKGNLMEGVLEIDILYSAILYALNRHREAKTLMTNTLAFAEAKGYIRPFVDYWPCIAKVLLDIAHYSSHHNSRYLYTILQACGISSESDIMKRHVLVVDAANLTTSEREVLRLISSGYTNGEIAARNFISQNTVKTHIRHIFDKLGVKTRVQAVLEAKKIFEPETSKITPPHHTAV